MSLNYTKTRSENLIHIHATLEETSKVLELQRALHEKKNHLFLKRFFDILLSVILIILFFPVLILTSLLIKLTSKGTIFYTDERIGFKGSRFRCYKFRSMVRDHTKKDDDYKIAMQQAQAGLLYKDKSDGRITAVGKILRKTSIDELPQLFNVLAGDMSMVGPRPLVPFMLKPFPEFEEVRSLIKPGITGLWQVKDRRSNTSAEFMIKHDTAYIENFNFFFDLKILAETPLVVFSGKGAL